MTGWVLAVDFGTTNTAAAACPMGRPDLARAVKLSSSSVEMPSAVLVKANDDGDIRILTGETARNSARASRVDAYEPTPKRRIGEDSVFLSGRAVPAVDLVAAVLAQVGQRAARQFDDVPPAEVRLTHPAQWAEWRRRVLVDAATKAGLPTPVLVPEPVAAATYYANQSSDRPSSGPIAVYDLGGGTFDVAVLKRSGDGFEVLAKEMVDPLGGEAFDRRLLDIVHEGLEAKGLSSLWNRLQGPEGLGWQRTLLDEIRNAKHVLSEELQADVAVQAGDQGSVVSVTREEFDRRIAPDLAKSIDATRSALDHARVSASQLERLYLVGGSSFIPAVSDTVTRELGVRPARFLDPKTVTALGALHVEGAAEPPPPPPPPPPARTGEKRPPPPTPSAPAPAPGSQPANEDDATSVRKKLLRIGAPIVVLFLVVGLLFSSDGNRELDELREDCDAGDMSACDTLYSAAPSGSDDEAFGSTCGNTREPTRGDCRASSTTTSSSTTNTTAESEFPSLEEFFPGITSDHGTCRDTTSTFEETARQRIGCDFSGFKVDFVDWSTLSEMRGYIDGEVEDAGVHVIRSTGWFADGKRAGSLYVIAVEGGHEVLWTVDAVYLSARLFAPGASGDEAFKIWEDRPEVRMDTSYLE